MAEIDRPHPDPSMEDLRPPTDDLISRVDEALVAGFTEKDGVVSVDLRPSGMARNLREASAAAEALEARDPRNFYPTEAEPGWFSPNIEISGEDH